jgi:hypothetical protein
VRQGIQNRPAENFCLSGGIRVACIAKNACSLENGACKFRQRPCRELGITQAVESDRSCGVPGCAKHAGEDS